MNKIKVLQVVGSMKIGGLEFVALNYYKYIDKSMFDFDYLVYGNEEGELEKEVYQLGGRIIRIPPPQKNIIHFVKNLKYIFNEYGQYDVVHSHTFFNSGMVLKIAESFNVPIRISHSHSSKRNEKKSFIKKIYIFLMRYLLNRNATNLLASSEMAGNYLYGDKKFKNNGQVVKNGIDLKKYIYNSKIRSEVRRELGFNHDFVIGHVGKLSKIKNQKFIIDILNEIKSYKKNVKLVLVGNGEIKKNLEDHAESYGIKNDVIFLGSRSDVHNILQGIDLFLFPSLHEGFGISLIEAQAAGLRCIVSDTIPQEAILTKLVTRLPLSSEASMWTKEILQYSEGYIRINTYKTISAYGYDIVDTAKQIEDLYYLEI